MRTFRVLVLCIHVQVLTAMLNKKNESEAARLAAQGGVPLAMHGNTNDTTAGARRKEVLSKVKGRLQKLM